MFLNAASVASKGLALLSLLLAVEQPDNFSQTFVLLLALLLVPFFVPLLVKGVHLCVGSRPTVARLSSILTSSTNPPTVWSVSLFNFNVVVKLHILASLHTSPFRTVFFRTSPSLRSFEVLPVLIDWWFEDIARLKF